MTEKANKNNLLTVVSGSFPPRESGSGILMAKLFSSYRGAVRILCGNDYYSKINRALAYPGETHQLLFLKYFPRLHSHLRMKNPLLASLVLKGEIRNHLSRSHSSAVVATFPWDVFLVASFLAAKEVKVPFFPYMHELWTENVCPKDVSGKFAKTWEAIIFKQSAGILCMTEFMKRHYEEKNRGSSCFVVPQTMSDEEFQAASANMAQPNMESPTIVFAGEVDPDQNHDALKVLAAASEMLPRDYRLVFCMTSDARALRKLGISSSRLQVCNGTPQEIKRLQSRAHVLIAPISHKNCKKDMVRTMFLTSLLPCLVSGRPIVVFAPKESYHIFSAKHNDWGYPVDLDSPEALAKAIVGAMNNILVAHVEGGEVSGTVDELIRHSVTKLSHLHFVANEEARWRLIQMGEVPDSIYVIGSPDIDVMLSDDLPSLSQVRQHYEIPFSQYGICLFHPVTTEVSMLREHANALVEALQASRKNFVMIYPNNDTGSNIILDAYKALEDHPRFKIIPSMRFEFFLRLLKHAQVIIGNSSAGIREAPVYQVPTVNIGSRQRDRFHHSSIYNVSPVADKIIECLEHLPQTVTPSFYFGHGKSAELFMACLREPQLWVTSPQKIFQTLEPNLKKIAEIVN